MEAAVSRWVVAMVSLVMHFASAGAVSDPTETAALLAIKKGIIDKSGKLGNWQGSDPCKPPTWTGLTCEYTDNMNVSHVTQIHLLQFNLEGTLASELGNFPNLTTLDLMWNQITGTIPRELGNLKQLKLLLLNGNQLIGPIPVELGNLSNMNRFQLDSNNLNGSIPASVGNLTQLKHLHLNNNSLIGFIPTEISGAHSLVHVLVDNNRLTGPLPANLSMVPSLTILQMDNNPIASSIPTQWTSLAGLLKLSLRNCSLTGQIPDLSTMTNLTYLDLSENSLQGAFPANFSTKLNTIDVSNNHLTGLLPESLGSLQDVQSLQFAFNTFNGSIPTTLGLGASFTNKTQKLLVDLRNNSLSALSTNIVNAATANQNVSFRLDGNPVCDSNGVLKPSVIFEFCILNNQTVTDSTTNGVPSCAKCDSPNMSVQDPSGKCRCAQPIQLDLRLKSPSFSFFEQFRGQFLDLVMRGLNLAASQVQLKSWNWEAGPRLHIQLFLFPTNSTFEPSEYQDLFNNIANWDLSAGEAWSLSVLGPYELLVFQEVEKGNSNGLSKGAIAGMIIGVLAALAIFLALGILLCCRKRVHAVWTGVPAKSFSERSIALMPPGLKLAGVKAFMFTEIQRATNNFAASCELGRGGYGNVYKGLLQDGTAVAVKRAEQSSLQGSDEFYTEIELLSRVHHRNLVALIGFCNDQGEQMLVYEFMPGGNLRDHLNPTEMFDYATRLHIALGTARGILYLHTEADPPIFHRDIKASNILLDNKFNAKVSDFGLSKLALAPEMSGGTPTGISTNVKGTPGYLDPEYFMTNKLTDKSDVYSFGVVLLELLTGMLPIAHGKNIVREMQDAVQAGTVMERVDPCMGPYPQEGFETLLRLALACVDTNQDRRPQMVEVARDLDSLWRATVTSESLFKGAKTFDSSSIESSERFNQRNTPLQEDMSWISSVSSSNDRSIRSLLHPETESSHQKIEVVPR